MKSATFALLALTSSLFSLSAYAETYTCKVAGNAQGVLDGTTFIVRVEGSKVSGSIDVAPMEGDGDTHASTFSTDSKDPTDWDVSGVNTIGKKKQVRVSYDGHDHASYKISINGTSGRVVEDTLLDCCDPTHGSADLSCEVSQ